MPCVALILVLLAVLTHAFDWDAHLRDLAQQHDAVVNDPNRLVYDTSEPGPPRLVPLAVLQQRLAVSHPELRPHLAPSAVTAALHDGSSRDNAPGEQPVALFASSHAAVPDPYDVSTWMAAPDGPRIRTVSLMHPALAADMDQTVGHLAMVPGADLSRPPTVPLGAEIHVAATPHSAYQRHGDIRQTIEPRDPFAVPSLERMVAPDPLSTMASTPPSPWHFFRTLVSISSKNHHTLCGADDSMPCPTASSTPPQALPDQPGANT
jgi:hypothetical protein